MSCKGVAKYEKYKYRTDRVLKDVLWHVLAIKRCTNEKTTRTRRGTRTRARKLAKKQRAEKQRKLRKGPAEIAEPAEISESAETDFMHAISHIQHQVLQEIGRYEYEAEPEDQEARTNFDQNIENDVNKYKISIEGKIRNPLSTPFFRAKLFFKMICIIL